jgi:hydroxypyruvate isomerase
MLAPSLLYCVRLPRRKLFHFIFSTAGESFVPRFSANLSWLFTELPMLARFDAAANAGFAAVEIAFPYLHSPEELRHRLQRSSLELVLFNAPAGDWELGDRGIACQPRRAQEFLRSIDTAFAYAKRLGVPRLHVMAGKVLDGESKLARNTFLANLRSIAGTANDLGITLLLETINSRDMPGYLIDNLETALDLCLSSGAPNVKLQLDLYHMQIIHGDLAMNLRKYLPQCGHIQIAGVPGRNEPDVGEVCYPYLFDLLDELGYEGWVGCEYTPRGQTLDGMDWLRLANNRKP